MRSHCKQHESHQPWYLYHAPRGLRRRCPRTDLRTLKTSPVPVSRRPGPALFFQLERSWPCKCARMDRTWARMDRTGVDPAKDFLCARSLDQFHFKVCHTLYLSLAAERTCHLNMFEDCLKFVQGLAFCWRTLACTSCDCALALPWKGLGSWSASGINGECFVPGCIYIDMDHGISGYKRTTRSRIKDTSKSLAVRYGARWASSQSMTRRCTSQT